MSYQSETPSCKADSASNFASKKITLRFRFHLLLSAYIFFLLFVTLQSVILQSATGENSLRQHSNHLSPCSADSSIHFITQEQQEPSKRKPGWYQTSVQTNRRTQEEVSFLVLPKDGRTRIAVVTASGHPLDTHAITISLIKNTSQAMSSTSHWKAYSRLCHSQICSAPACQTAFHFHENKLRQDKISQTKTLMKSSRSGYKYFQTPVYWTGRSGATTTIQIKTKPIVQGDWVRVYFDDDQQPTSTQMQLAKEIVRLLETKIASRLNPLLGTPKDVDQDGFLSVVLTSKFNPYGLKSRPDQTPIRGFVRKVDFSSPLKTDRPEINASSRSDAIFLDARLNISHGLTELLAHEYAHVLCLSTRLSRLSDGTAPCSSSEEEDWLNEAIAHIAERLCGRDNSNLKKRLISFYRHPEKSPLCIKNYWASGYSKSSGCRGSCASFLNHAVSLYGDGLLSQLASSPHAGVQNMEQSTGEPMSRLIQDWGIELVENRIENVTSDHVSFNPVSASQSFPMARSFQMAGTTNLFFEFSSDASSLKKPTRHFAPDVEVFKITASPDSRIQIAIREP